MAYNYNVSGLNVDFGALMAQKAKKEAYEEEKESSRLARERELKYSNLYSEYKKTKNPNMIRSMASLNPAQTKQILDIDEKLGKQEKESLASGIIESKANLTAGKVKQSRQLWLDRGQILSNYGSDSSFTTPIREAALNATDEEFEKVLNIGFNTAIAMGVIPQGEDEEIGDYFDADGNQYSKFYNKTYGTTHDVLTGQTLESIETETAAKTKAGRPSDSRDLNKELSVMRSKYIENSSATNARASQAANIATQLKEQLKNGIPTERSGTVGKVFDQVLGLVGKEDALTFLRTETKNLLANELVSMLPKGAASDRDVAIMAAALPDAYANPDQLFKWLGAYDRVSKKLADASMLKAEWIETTGSGIVSPVDTNMRGIKVDVGTRFDQFYKRYENKQEKERREAEKRETDLGNLFGTSSGVSSGVSTDVSARAMAEYGIKL